MATEAIDVRLARLEGAFEQVDKRLGTIEADLRDLRNELGTELRGRRAENRQQFHWLLGLILITILMPVALRFLPP